MGRAGLVAAVLLLPGLARAQDGPCDAGLIDAGVLLAGPNAADFGQIPEACPGTDLFARLRGELLVDKDDFYGVITGGLTLRGRWSFAPGWYLSGALDAATLRYPINAVVTSTGVGFGPATLGLHRAFFIRKAAITPYLRFLLPPNTARHYGFTAGGELGGSAQVRLLPRLSLRGGLSAPATLTVIGGGGHGIFAPSGLLEGAYLIKEWFAVSAGAAARVQAAPHAALSALAARASARIATRGGWHVALAADVPVAGKDRTDLTASIFVGRGAPRGDRSMESAPSPPSPVWPWQWSVPGMPPGVP